MSLKSSQRVFVGIKVAEEIAEMLLNLETKLGDWPARFIPPEDIHMTLLPPWEMTDQDYTENKIREALKSATPFTLKSKCLSCGPNVMKPKLLWIKCEASQELIQLKKSLLKAFNVIERVPFVPHITIARIPNKNIIDTTKCPVIERPIKFFMPVESVQLFSSPHKGGKGYEVLASIPIPLKF